MIWEQITRLLGSASFLIKLMILIKPLSPLSLVILSHNMFSRAMFGKNQLSYVYASSTIIVNNTLSFDIKSLLLSLSLLKLSSGSYSTLLININICSLCHFK